MPASVSATSSTKRFTAAASFEGDSHSTIRRINATIVDGLDEDERGEYRRGPVIVGGMYEPPDHRWVPGLMRQLVDWLNEASEHVLIRAGLAHLNVVSIHPWLNGNGRTSRVVGSLSLMRGGIAAPELVNIEAVIRADPDAYVDMQLCMSKNRRQRPIVEQTKNAILCFHQEDPGK
jgi:Fic family protein